MSNTHRLIAIVASLALGVCPVAAQNAPAGSQEPIKLNLTIEPQLVRFATPGEELDWRLEVVNQLGQPVFDSAFVAGNVLDWPLVDAQGQAVGSDLYSYTLTIKTPGADRTRHGQLIVEKAATGGHRVWATSDHQAALGENGETMLTVTGDAETQAAGQPAIGGAATGVATGAQTGSTAGSLRQNFAPVTF